MASRADEYRRRAHQCLEMAGGFRDREARSALSHMAEVWLRLADDFRLHGRQAIEVRKTQPAAYLKIWALLVPKEMKVENVPAISRHCWARRQYSSALLATAYCPRPLDDERGRRQLVRSIQQQNPASGRPGRGFCARYARETNAPIRATTVSSIGSQSRSPFQ